MRILLFTLLLAFTGILADDGEKEGRRGNELYEQGSYGPAAEAYREGLASLGSVAISKIRYGLENNLGAALLKAGDAAAAAEAFSRALASSPEVGDFARTSYNAGNAAFSAQELEKALTHYRESLLRDPDNQDAKFNYEFVKRQLDQQQQQQQQQGGDDQQQQDQDQQEQNGQGDQQQDQQQSQQEDQEQGDGEQQQGDQPEDQQQQQSQQSQTQAQEAPQELSEEQAQRILQALQNEEEQLLRQVQRKDAPARQVEKDW